MVRLTSCSCSVKIEKLKPQDITTYLVRKARPELVFEELCTGIGRYLDHCADMY